MSDDDILLGLFKRLLVSGVQITWDDSMFSPRLSFHTACILSRDEVDVVHRAMQLPSAQVVAAQQAAAEALRVTARQHLENPPSRWHRVRSWFWGY